MIVTHKFRILNQNFRFVHTKDYLRARNINTVKTANKQIANATMYSKIVIRITILAF